ncbi:Eukaryotic cytochrome b561 [Seminavis robusta]|uniref:Eukaryotic cytochrome b561 n=1 Tax=Seminavis robusta TaxID=568900 RepID=A0A9N8H4D8_9STRA|nr:Eukaryotic cytochrome b561 [Seminavis robusta]|eukprot:Sro7_g005880.1 Eukaryotic cytochrome b561 (1984) ;mRNA; f:72944-79296
MKIFGSILDGLAISPLFFLLSPVPLVHGQGQDSCDGYTTTIVAEDAPSLRLSFVADMSMRVLRGQVEYEGAGWVGFGVNPTGPIMTGAQAVVGQESGIARYNLGIVPDVTPIEGVFGPEGVFESWEMNATHAVLTFGWPLDKGDFSIDTEGGINYFLVAGGWSGIVGHHAARSPIATTVEPCVPTGTSNNEAGAVVVQDAVVEEAQALSVGQNIIVEGYVMDQFCIDQGFFLDTKLPTLTSADLHTFHCLLDPAQCYESTFEILTDPDYAAGETMWSRGYTVDDDSRALLIEEGRRIGNCVTCTGGETGQLAGFRVRLDATVLVAERNLTSGAGPLLSINAVESVGQYSVGQVIQVEGYIMDQFCIDRGSFVDTGLPSLANADKHTVHCLVDPPQCFASPWEVLIDPASPDGNWTRGFTLDPDSKQILVDLAKQVGDCTDCTGEGSLKEGFRAMITATVVDNQRNLTSGSGPLISVTEAVPILSERDSLAVGDVVEVEGYVMDQFCIDQGVFLDTGLATLEFADQHTFHCLLDPPQCVESTFVILIDPDYEAGETMWSPGYTLDNDSRALVIAEGRRIGNCVTCTGGELGQLAGFRVRVDATVVATARDMTSGSGPLLSVNSVESVGQYSVGQVIQVEGYIMDQFCIDRGTFVDTGLPSLANADKHTVHCLVDPPQCVGSPWEVLIDPVAEGGNWTRGFTLDPDSKQILVDLAKQVGECTFCTGEGTLKEGFRAMITATIVDNQRNLTSGSGPLISVSQAVPILEPRLPGGGTCEQPPVTLTFDEIPGVTVTYELGVDEATNTGTFSATVVYEGLAWVGFAISPTGRMQDSNAVIGMPGEEESETNPGKYFLGGYTADGITLSEQQTLLSKSLEQNDTHTVLSFTKLLEEPDEVAITPSGDNNFLVAVGLSNEFGYHAARHPFTESITCGGGAVEVAKDVTTVDQEAPMTTGADDGPVGCKPFVQSVSIAGLTLNYVVDLDDDMMNGNFSAELIYAGQGWVGFGISPDGAMIGSLAVIGVPGQPVGPSNPGKYILNAKSPSGAELLPDSQQTIMDGNIVQNETHTVMTFTKRLTEPGEIEIIADTQFLNNFLAAAGIDNDSLGFHISRGATQLGLAPATESCVELQAGDVIVVEGYVMDQFCIEQGFFVDTLLPSLEFADQHTFHCLLDPPQCLESPFEILIDPDYTDGETMWSRGYTLDDASRALVIEEGRRVGNCNTCTGGEMGQLAGFRVRVNATVLVAERNLTSGSGPLLSVNSLESIGQYSVGQVIQVEGYIMDQFCIDRGTFVDTGLPSLANADMHTVHCLVDPPQCVGSPWEVLIDPVVLGGNWTRGFTLDPDSKQILVDLAKQVGDCTDCTGEGTLKEGFRAMITATIVDNQRNLTSGSGPLISVTEAVPILPGGGGTCEQPPVTLTFDEIPGVTVTYELGVDEESEMGTFSATVVYEGLAWVGFAISPTGRMQDSNAVIGMPGEEESETNPGKYFLGGYTADGITLSEQQTLLSKSLEQNDTHTVLSFTKLLEEPDEVAITTSGDNNFLVAVGLSNEFGYHAARHPFTERITCGGGAVDVAEDVATVDQDAPVADDGPVDCSTFVQSVSIAGLSLNYVVNLDDDMMNGNFSAELIYAGQGWVGFGISPDGAMIGSLAVIGVPGQPVGPSNPGKYILNAKSPGGAELLPDSQQTIMDGNIVQNETHTVMTFTKRLTEPGEIEIIADTQFLNNFLAAAGIDNDSIGFHISRGATQLGLAPCTETGIAEAASVEQEDRPKMRKSFAAHGWLACIAWGILVPIAIGNSLCRHLIPVQGLWFEIHRAFNSLAILLTLITFVIVVNAVEKSSSNPDHFQSTDGALGKHKTIGLVVFILSLIQGIGGLMRPHLPKKNDDGTDAEPKSPIRTLWEFVHKGSGYAILAMAWYQCHSGLVKNGAYLARFPQDDDYSDVFWGVTGAISAIVFVGALTRFAMPPPAAPQQHSPVFNEGAGLEEPKA